MSRWGLAYDNSICSHTAIRRYLRKFAGGEVRSMLWRSSFALEYKSIQCDIAIYWVIYPWDKHVVEEVKYVVNRRSLVYSESHVHGYCHAK